MLVSVIVLLSLPRRSSPTCFLNFLRVLLLVVPSIARYAATIRTAGGGLLSIVEFSILSFVCIFACAHHL